MPALTGKKLRPLAPEVICQEINSRLFHRLHQNIFLALGSGFHPVERYSIQGKQHG
jgi:hypothetical protein